MYLEINYKYYFLVFVFYRILSFGFESLILIFKYIFFFIKVFIVGYRLGVIIYVRFMFVKGEVFNCLGRIR